MPQGSYLHQAMLSAPEKSAPSRRIEILRTEGEWSAISHLLADQKHCDLHAYLHREISRLTNKFGECEVCITPADGIMKTFRHNIPTHIYEKLLPIAIKTRKAVATLVDEMLITPLLLPEKDKDAAL